MTKVYKKGTWTTMKDGSAEDFQAINAYDNDVAKHELVPHLLAELKSLAGDSPYPIDRYQHSLQSATLAERDGASEEMIVAALLHDVADGLAIFNHADVAASILKPYISEKTYWIVKHHAIFQGVYFWHHIGMDPNARDKYKGHKWFDDCAYFCEHYDQNAFDPAYDTLPLEHFEPMVKRIFARQPFGDHLKP